MTAACALLIAPLLVVEAPPLLDYLNHLARIAILADGGADPVLASMYAPHWAVIPNLGLDILLTPLMRVMPPLTAGRIAAAVVLLLPFIGTIAYSRAIYRRSSYWPLGATLVSYNATFLLGFMNFLAGIGFAMLLASAWINWRDRHPAPTVLLCSVGTVGLFFCHLMGLLLALVLIAAFELDSSIRRPSAVKWRALSAAPLVIGPGVLYMLAPLAKLSTGAQYLPFGDKTLQLLAPFISYNPFIDLMSSAVVGLCIIGLLVTGYLRIRRSAAIAVIVLFALYLGLPFIAKGIYFVDTRITIMLGYLLFGAVIPVAVPFRTTNLISVALIGAFILRMGTVLSVWSGYQQDLDGMRAAIHLVQPGQRVYLVSVSPEEAPAYWQRVPPNRMLWTGVRLDYHLAALVSLEHHAFWPGLFADPSQQPIMALPPYDALAVLAGSVAPHLQPGVIGPMQLCEFDYVLLLNAGGEPDLAGYGGGRLDLLESNEVAALFKVKKQPETICVHLQKD